MRVTTILGRTMLAGMALVALQGCGEAPSDEPTPQPTLTPSTEPDLTGPVPAAETAPPPQSCEPTSYCSGALVVRSDNLALSRSSNGLVKVVGTLSFENRSANDLRVALIDRNLVLNTDKGIVAEQRGYYTTGLGVCRNEGSECFDSKPDTFRLIAPGDSPAKVNVSLSGSFDASQTPLVSQIETGTLTLEAYSVAADGSRQMHRIALASVPISNQAAE